MNQPTPASRLIEALCAALLGLGLGAIQVLIGGTRLLFSLPAYGVIALAGVLSLFLLRRAKPQPDWFCFASAALFFGYILARALTSPVRYIARADIYSVLAGLLVYFLVACVITGPRKRMWLLFFLLALAMVHVLVGAIQFRNGDNFMPISFLQRHDYGRRASGLYICPNHLAGLLEVLGVFGLSIVCWSRWSPAIKLLTAYAAGVCYLGLALTGSRGGFLSAAVSLMALAILTLVTLRQTNARTFWAVTGASAIGMLVILGGGFSLVHQSVFLNQRAQNVIDPRDIRIDLWQAAIQQWKLQPIFGTGSGTYLYYGRQFRTDRVVSDPVYVHNDYLQLLADYGLVGVAVFLPFLAAHLYSGWKNFQQLGPKHVSASSQLLSDTLALNIGAMAALSAYVVHSIFDFNLHIPANVLLLAFVFGILANSGNPRTALLSQPNKWQTVWRLAPVALGLILIFQGIRLLPGEYFAEMARTSLRDNDNASAIAFARHGLETEHQNPYLYQYLGSALLEQGDDLPQDQPARTSFYENAISAFAKARDLAPLDKTFPQALGSLYDLLGRFPEAEWNFDEALALDPKSKPTWDCYEAHLKTWREGGSKPKPPKS